QVRAKIAEIAVALRSRRYRLIEVGRDSLLAPLFGPEEECLRFTLVVDPWDINRPTDRVSEIILLVWRNAGIKVILGVKGVVPNEFVNVAVKRIGTRLGFDLNRSRAIASILGAVVRGQDFEFGNGIDAGVNVQRGVTAVVHVVAAVELPVVVLDTA